MEKKGGGLRGVGTVMGDLEHEEKQNEKWEKWYDG